MKKTILCTILLALSTLVSAQDTINLKEAYPERYEAFLESLVKSYERDPIKAFEFRKNNDYVKSKQLLVFSSDTSLSSTTIEGSTAWLKNRFVYQDVSRAINEIYKPFVEDPLPRVNEALVYDTIVIGFEVQVDTISVVEGNIQSSDTLIQSALLGWRNGKYQVVSKTYIVDDYTIRRGELGIKWMDEIVYPDVEKAKKKIRRNNVINLIR